MKQPNLILIRHGESLWNKSNRFTGWTDIGLSEKGKREAARAGRLLKKKGFVFDEAYSSVLKRSLQTLFLVMKQLNAKDLPVHTSWRLNERHYGALQGLNKLKMIKKYGADQVMIWRRSYSVAPPLAEGKISSSHITAAQCGLKASQLPKGESLRDTYRRVIPYWKQTILPAIKRGENVLVVAHGNSLRALVKYLDKVSDKEIMNVEIPTGKPAGYYIGRNGKVAKKVVL